MTQSQLAERAGVSLRWLTSLEGGAPGAALGAVLRTLAALQLELAAGAVDAGAPPGGIDLDEVLARFDLSP